jgi:hypothetical protein
MCSSRGDKICDFLKNYIKLKFIIREGHNELPANDSTEQCGGHSVEHLVCTVFEIELKKLGEF